jgi:UDP-2-acetamido-3-amino-2,3-dideoxy-glucuronate N-acetyltransferase
MVNQVDGGDIRVAVIGCGYWGKNHVRNYAEIGALEALVDRNEGLVRDLIAKHGGRALTFEQALADPDIDAFAFAMPPSQNHAMGLRALEAGKHVFIEKPISLEVKKAEELCATAERLDRRLMVGHILQYHPAFLKLKELVREGRLGQLRYVTSTRLNLGRIRREEDVFWALAPHDISMILSLIGTEPSKVEAVGGYHLHPTIADVTTTHLSFPGGEQAHIFVSWLHPYKEQKIAIVGSEAMAVFDDGEPWERKLVLYPHRLEWKNNIPVPTRAAAVPVDVDQEEPLRQECLHFLNCVRTGARPRTDGREGLRVLRVLDRASHALLAGKAAAADQSQSASLPRPARPPRVTCGYPGVSIHESAYVDAGVEIGEGSKIWHFSHLLPGVKLGRGVIVGQNVVIGPQVSVGDKCKIQNNVSLYKGVTLEEGVFCGPSCVFTNVNNPRAEIERKSEFRPTLVKRGVTIGANATIVCGYTIGQYAFIAAGAVVTEDVPAFALVAGVPARRIGWMSHAGHKLGPDLVCPGTGRRYREAAPELLEEIA